jgi:hypothetical protein
LNQLIHKTKREKLIDLRQRLELARDEMIEAEADLAEQEAELVSFERVFDHRVGRLVDRLAQLDAEIEQYRHQLQLQVNFETYGSDHVPVEEQFRQTWNPPQKNDENNGLQDDNKIDEKELKRLYRKLARRYHPDLASDPVERTYRTEKMAALNEAYGARSLVEMSALAAEPTRQFAQDAQIGQTEDQMLSALQQELNQIERRIREIKFKMSNIHHRDSVELSLKAKLAQRMGRDLLGEMASDLRKRITLATAERDQLKARMLSY